jgi:hypothetical protein
MSNTDRLSAWVGQPVSALVEVRGDGGWRGVAALHGVLSAPYGADPGGTWDVGGTAVLMLHEDVPVRPLGRGVVADFGDARVSIAPDSPSSG